MALELTDIKNFEDLDEITTMASTDILPITDVSEPADNKVTVQTLAENLNVLGGGVYLTSGRKFAEEKWSTVTEDGLYVIAETDTTSHQNTAGILDIIVGGNSRLGRCRVYFGAQDAPTAGTLSEIKYEALENTTGIPIKGIYLAYADSVGAGLKVLIDIDVNVSVTIGCTLTQIAGSAGTVTSQSGMSLVTATTTDNDLTPDGSTASYLEAGTEFVLHNYRNNVNILGYMSTTAGVVDVIVNWKQIPKQDATDLNITIPSSLILRDTYGNTCTLTTSPTISSVDTVVDGEVAFRMTDATNITGLTTGSPIFFYPSGGAVTLTLS